MWNFYVSLGSDLHASQLLKTVPMYGVCNFCGCLGFEPAPSFQMPSFCARAGLAHVSVFRVWMPASSPRYYKFTNDDISKVQVENEEPPIQNQFQKKDSTFWSPCTSVFSTGASVWLFLFCPSVRRCLLGHCNLSNIYLTRRCCPSVSLRISNWK